MGLHPFAQKGKSFCATCVMKVLSWNILASEWIKKSYYKGVDDKILFNTARRTRTIFKRIEEERADVLMLQEVMKSTYKKLKERYGKAYHISELSPIQWSYGKGSQSGNVTLLKKKIFKGSAKSVVHEYLPFAVHTVFTPSAARNGPISFFNIHLDDISPKTRAQQLEELKKSFTKRTIVAGDFNHPYRSNSALYNSFGRGFEVHNFCPTYYIEKKLNIDNIVIRGFKHSKEELEGDSCEPYPKDIEQGFTEYGSDHLPVKTFVELNF